MRKNIDVIAKMTNDGKVIPLSIIWEDNKKFIIDKILSIDKIASKIGGMGIRYTCKINGFEKFLWLDGYVWFIETK